jgi:hypothetical protein
MDTQGEPTRTARRMWLWPVAILVGFPIGGLIADLVVDGVDSVGAALAGGLIAGVIIGARSGSLCGSGSPGSGSRRRLQEWQGALPRERLWSITASTEGTFSSWVPSPASV